MRKRIIGGGSIIIAVICIAVVVLILKWNNQDLEIVSDSDDSIDLEVTIEEEEQNIEDSTVSKDLMVADSELDESTEDVVEVESSEASQIETSIEIETDDIEVIETAETETVITDVTETTGEVDYAAKYKEAVEGYNELKERGIENLSDDEKLRLSLYSQNATQYRKLMLDEYLIKLQPVASSVGVSIGSMGTALVENLTAEDEPYYSILKSVNATGYYFTINGAVSDTVYLFYVNQDDEVVYYGFVDLLDY